MSPLYSCNRHSFTLSATSSAILACCSHGGRHRQLLNSTLGHHNLSKSSLNSTKQLLVAAVRHQINSIGCANLPSAVWASRSGLGQRQEGSCSERCRVMRASGQGMSTGIPNRGDKVLKDGGGLETVLRYHEESKHSFQAFAAGPGGLDWANQPEPFRRYRGAEVVSLDRLPPPALKPSPHQFGGAHPNFGTPAEGCPEAVDNAYEAAFEGHIAPRPLTRATLSQLLYDCLALSAWKRAGWSTWSLRVNPSSGNLHPTEGYIVSGPIAGVCDRPMVAHYAPKEHALEIRANLPHDVWSSISGHLPEGCILFGLTSIYWREAWKYGIRGFRYCHHDVGHAIGAIAVAAANLGWDTRMLDTWTSPDLERLLGLSQRTSPPSPPSALRESAGKQTPLVDGVKHPRPPLHKKPAAGMRVKVTEPEREHPDCLLAIFPRGSRGGDDLKAPVGDVAAALRERLKALDWAGEANKLSKEHVHWPVIDQVSAATAKVAAGDCLEGRMGFSRGGVMGTGKEMESEKDGEEVGSSGGSTGESHLRDGQDNADGTTAWRGNPAVYEDFTLRQVVHKRRSGVDMDERYGMSRDAFYQILCKCCLHPCHASDSHPSSLGGQTPFGALPWRPQVHLAIFAHRIADLTPGLYMLVRNHDELPHLRSSLRPEFEWVRPQGCPPGLPLFLLAKGDLRSAAVKLSCNQEIAGNSCFSLGMLTRFEASLQEHGPSFYPRLFWETGVVGQQLYLEAHAVGVSATGIGCFFDDPVHTEVLGVEERSYQSLYHFTVGVPVEDPRILQLAPYPGPNSGF